MNLFKRCKCPDPAKCRCPLWYRFRLHGRQHRGTTNTAKRALAEGIAHKRRLEMIEKGEGFRRVKPVKLTEHVKAYVAHTAKTNRSSYKDQAVLDRFVASVGNRSIAEVSPFHVERWKQERAAIVTQSTVNRELNIVRGCFSRAVDWKRLSTSPCAT